ncbi:MAG: phosphoenolpyruvate hydrolase family protein [Hyphomicrobiales bacterium]|nr:phosphoenolpyruvate hydrolase family protein [Hyphomicrobiales bacterium]
MTGAGNGIAAKFIERGGVDLIGVYNTGYFRVQRLGSLAGMLPILDANELVMRTAEREVLPQVAEIPVVVGVNGVDPLRDMSRFLEGLARIKVSGVHNFPTVAWFDGSFRRSLEATGLGYAHELEMLRTARALDILTVGYAFNAEDTEQLMTEAAPDVFIFHAGITTGGSTGDAGAASLEDTATWSEHHFAIAQAVQPEVILLAHGAAIVDPEGAQYMLDHTRCHGVQLGSGIERMAIERPIEARAAAFKAGRLPAGRT